LRGIAFYDAFRQIAFPQVRGVRRRFFYAALILSGATGAGATPNRRDISWHDGCGDVGLSHTTTTIPHLLQEVLLAAITRLPLSHSLHKVV